MAVHGGICSAPRCILLLAKPPILATLSTGQGRDNPAHRIRVINGLIERNQIYSGHDTVSAVNVG